MTTSNTTSTPTENVAQFPRTLLTPAQLSDRIFELQVLLEAAAQNTGDQDKRPNLEYFLSQIDSKLCALAETYDDVSMSFENVAQNTLAGVEL